MADLGPDPVKLPNDLGWALVRGCAPLPFFWLVTFVQCDLRMPLGIFLEDDPDPEALYTQKDNTAACPLYRHVFPFSLKELCSLQVV